MLATAKICMQTNWGKLKDWIEQAASSPRAPYWLGGYAFAESLIIPLPTELMLTPMVLSRRHHRFYLIFLAAFGTALGASTMYPAGLFLLEHTFSILQQLELTDTYTTAQKSFQQYGAWLLLIGSITPIPLKMLMFVGGAAKASWVLLIFSCFLGQVVRFAVIVLLIEGGRAVWLSRGE